jgi:hypothetical protein
VTSAMPAAKCDRLNANKIPATSTAVAAKFE